MSSFQSSVMFIAIVLLIICLIFIGIALYRNKFNKQFPPVTANCPDYWSDESVNNDGSKCVNSQNVGNSQCAKTMDFSGSIWSGNKGLCYKSQWAKSCDLTWDGLDNNTDICADGPPS
jgi:hypothetical protein